MQEKVCTSTKVISKMILFVLFALLELSSAIVVSLEERAAMKPSNYAWPDAKIPYHIKSDVPGEVKNTIKSAIASWQAGTCLQFEEKTNLDSMNNKNLLVFEYKNNPTRAHVKDCNSNFPFHQDMSKNIHRSIYLPTTCTDITRITREIGLQIGLIYEHTRNDRDNYVTVKTDSYFFIKDPNANYEGFPYDFKSIMHPPSFDPDYNTDVIIPKNRFKGTHFGKSTKPSHLDIKAVNQLYKCNERCRNPPQCKNHGEVRHPNCNVCVCREGYSGNFCENRNWGLYAAKKVHTGYMGLISGAVSSHIAAKFNNNSAIGAAAANVVTDLFKKDVKSAPYDAIAGASAALFVEQVGKKLSKKWQTNTVVMLGGAVESTVGDLLKRDLKGAMKNAISKGAGALVGEAIGEVIGAEFGGPFGAMIGTAAGEEVAEVTGELVDTVHDEISNLWGKVSSWF